MKQEENALFMIFRLDCNEYCIPGESVTSIAIPEKFISLPNAPPTFAGFMMHKGVPIPVTDLRAVFHMRTLAQMVEQFGEMKEMHIAWTKALEEAVKKRAPFTHPVDPHLCRFGRWYDHFHTEDFTLNLILKRIAKPHESIHFCGARANEQMARGKYEAAAAQMEEAKRICRDEMIPLLDRLIDAYRDTNRGVVLILEEGGLLVDQVTGLLAREQTVFQELPKPSPHLQGIILAQSKPLPLLKLPFTGAEA